MIQKAIFAGGCFWCMVKPFHKYSGVLQVVSGYTGGWKEYPTYREVCSGTTGHLEAVEITFDDQIISYMTLLDIFWQQIDPTDDGGQFNDRVSSYLTAIFYTSNKQKEMAETSRDILNSSGRFPHPIVTKVLPATAFYPAEEEHQDFYQKHPEYYSGYRRASGRAGYLERFWSAKKPNIDHLTPLQKSIAIDGATEPPYQNAYWNHFAKGLYVDVIDGTPLFVSDDKFDDGHGWPSFSRPVNHELIIEKLDLSHNLNRIEVRSRDSNAHLGHVFDDGPLEMGGRRYCINSAALRFIPYERLDLEGYKEYKVLFK